MELKDIISTSINEYKKKDSFIKSPTLTPVEKEHWGKYIGGSIMKDGYKYSSSSGSPIAIYTDIYDIDTLFNGNRINFNRMDAFRKWCVENGVYLHFCYNSRVELIPSETLALMKEEKDRDGKPRYKITKDDKIEGAINILS